MKSKSIGLIVAGVVYFAWTFAVTACALDDPKSKETPDQRFETLLAGAMKAPEKTDWKLLREAFSKTTHYHPYSLDVTEKLKEIRLSIGRGETKETEADLLKLLERERFMRLDTLAILIAFYEQSNQPKKAAKYVKLLEGILKVLEYPKAGTSFENPIHVLFVDEEYLVTIKMQVKGQSLVSDKGHRFDVLEVEADGDKSGKNVYFNIDLLSNAKGLLDK